MTRKEFLSGEIRLTEESIIEVLSGAYNSGELDEESKAEYYLSNVKELLFMRKELMRRLEELDEEFMDDDGSIRF